MPIILGSRLGGSGGGAPSGPAGGDLAGTYPNPTVTNLIPKTLVDAKGDLLVATAADTVARLAVGATNDMVLRVDSGTASGLEYALPPGYVLDRTEAAGPVTISTTTQPGDIIVSLPARVYDGSTTVAITVYIGRVDTGATDNSEVAIDLSDGATQVGRLGIITTRAAEATYGTIMGAIRVTPTAASHTYHARGVRAASNGAVHGTDFGYAPIFIQAAIA